ncbi:MAG: plasmid replication protein RepC [Pararhodobacter sp.]
MEYTPLSPFKRPISHAHLRVVGKPGAPAPARPVNKWEVLRELSKAQAAFGISERDLTILQGLLSFFPDDMLGSNTDMVVFPSNKTLCERLNGMACSTMRRHLARLVDAGLLLRRDSPNGKRYVRKAGPERVSFGFDLSPLHRRAEEIARAAEAVRAVEDRAKRLREVVSLMRRDLAALAEFGEEVHPGLGLWDQLRDAAALTARALRRKLMPEDLAQYRDKLEVLLDEARILIDGAQTEEMITSDAHFEQHHLRSEKDSQESEPEPESGNTSALVCQDEPRLAAEDVGELDVRPIPKIPLHLVIASCPTLATFYDGPVRHWHHLHSAASHIRPTMGISASAWEEAQRCMGPEQAAVVVVAMLERFAEIRSPGGYLRALTAKAAAGAFSCGPMIMALTGRRRAA